jgi:steroid delta-isomerase-like uncharacterized protein
VRALGYAEQEEGLMSAEDNAAVVRRVYTTFNDHDLDAAAALVTDDFELVDVATGLTYHGSAGFREWLAPWLAAVPDARTEVTSLIVQGDWVATEHTGRGTHSGSLPTPGGELPPSGRPVELRFGEFFELRGGKIARLRAYWDVGTLLRQVT